MSIKLSSFFVVKYFVNHEMIVAFTKSKTGINHGEVACAFPLWFGCVPRVF